MNTIFINSKTSKTADPYRTLFKLTEKITLKRSDQILAHTIHGSI